MGYYGITLPIDELKFLKMVIAPPTSQSTSLYDEHLGNYR
jgi:hypothetical protein